MLGVLGVIGPTRMAYERVIPVVQAAADALGAALNPAHRPHSVASDPRRNRAASHGTPA